MKIVTFYSYKGGVGRSLALVNVAHFLARFGKRVVALDLDVEAPGLHYKFGVDLDKSELPLGGAVDVIAHARREGAFPDDLRGAAIEIQSRVEGEPSITFIPAGRAPSAAYWNTLEALDLPGLFRRDSDETGVALFFELIQRIELDFGGPDFLLVDARTGITEIGGVASTILADSLLCFTLDSEESLRGTSVVLAGVQRATAAKERATPDIIPVVSRVAVTPPPGAAEPRADLCKRVAEKLNRSLPADCPPWMASDVVVLAQDEQLMSRESTLLALPTEHRRQLFSDYLDMVYRVVTPKELADGVGRQSARLRKEIFDEPERVTRDAESLAVQSRSPDAWRELLRIYRLRNTRDLAMVAKALNVLGEAAADALVRDTLRAARSDGLLLELSFATHLLNAWRADDEVKQLIQGMVTR